MIPTLRPYQVNTLDEIRSRYLSGTRSVCLVSPTGSGKTIVFNAIIEGAMRRGKRCLIVAHRAEIVEQISNALVDLGIAHGVIAPGYPNTLESVQVASVASLVRRLDRHSHYDLIVIDECHHAVAGTWRHVIEATPTARILGVSATPERLDGCGLGDIFETMVLGPTTAELIRDGYLARFSYFAPTNPDMSDISTRAGDFADEALSDMMTKPVIIGSAISAYTKFCAGKRAVVFGVDRRHSMMLAERFRESGRKAVHLDGDTPKEERRRMIKALATGEIEIVTNCGLISEGVDIPTIDAVLMARPTQSLAMYLQQVGRALRLSPGKDRAVLLDLAGNVFRFGMPDADRQWSLDAKSRKQRERGKPPQFRCCESCGALNKPKVSVCTSCGAGMKLTAQEMQEVEIELKRIADLKRFEAIRAMSYEAAIRWAGADKRRLQQVAMARGYASGWVWYRLQELNEVA